MNRVHQLRRGLPQMADCLQCHYDSPQMREYLQKTCSGDVSFTDAMSRLIEKTAIRIKTPIAVSIGGMSTPEYTHQKI